VLPSQVKPASQVLGHSTVLPQPSVVAPQEIPAHACATACDVHLT